MIGALLAILFLALLFQTISKYHGTIPERVEQDTNIQHRMASLNHRFNNTVMRKLFRRLLWFPIFPLVIIFLGTITIMIEALGQRIPFVIYRIEMLLLVFSDLGVTNLFIKDPIIWRTLQDDREIHKLKVLLAKFLRKTDKCVDEHIPEENSDE
ncbi:hypothetical protein AX774_g3383 [Zancudomyces culisetae]|uniref:Uncharacterized protein n=1 Tax=Zancudomyces culisetae TaxID=1213189 RepID=A0A1R1PQ75_ZANCU|nr:hypothetical protein AX774_g3383 [Zancudomyces culisetae]|eukprot:OMH83114.1 hypothetical protein AX774_g3383 [Zancudomyces culisetae]